MYIYIYNQEQLCECDINICHQWFFIINFPCTFFKHYKLMVVYQVFITGNERMFRVKKNFHVQQYFSKIHKFKCEDAFSFGLFCKAVANDRARHCGISKCNSLYEIQFLTACFCNPIKNARSRGDGCIIFCSLDRVPSFPVSLSSPFLYVTLVLITLIPCHLLRSVW